MKPGSFIGDDIVESEPDHPEAIPLSFSLTSRNNKHLVPSISYEPKYQIPPERFETSQMPRYQ